MNRKEGKGFLRFIPAYAGNSNSKNSSRTSISGSSPLTRGTQTPFLLMICVKRFIPAYAGNSKYNPPKIPGFSVHPRLRGELIRSEAKVGNPVGSSPLTRGTPPDARLQRPEYRFIPAYAGNSWVISMMKLVRFGSSPLTRGTLQLPRTVLPIKRFIPAYAGNSGLRPAFRKSPTVHPRLRGELDWNQVV